MDMANKILLFGFDKTKMKPNETIYLFIRIGIVCSLSFISSWFRCIGDAIADYLFDCRLFTTCSFSNIIMMNVLCMYICIIHGPYSSLHEC